MSAELLSSQEQRRPASCPVCGGKEIVRLEPARKVLAYTTSGEDHTFVLGLEGCEDCQFIFQSPRASLQEMTTYYSLQARKPRSIENLEKPFADLLDHQAAFVMRHWNPVGHQRILDIGAAEGFFLERLDRECDAAVVLEGIEPGSVYAQAARELLPYAIIHEETLETASLPEQAYDLVTLRHVLEHILDPKAALIKIHEILKPHGFVHVELPDVTDFPATVSPFLHHEHINSFSPSNLRYLFESAGFDILEMESANDNPVGSGFAYPIQRVLATPSREPHGVKIVPQGKTCTEIYDGYNERQRTFLADRIYPTRDKINALVKDGKKVAVFGAGPHTSDLFYTLGFTTETFSVAFDNNVHKAGKQFRGIPILAPTRDALADVDAVVISSEQYELAIADQIASFGLPDLQVLRLYS